MQTQATAASHPSPAQIERLPVRSGVLVVDGYGVKLGVRHGRLVVSDGIGRDRGRHRSAERPRGSNES